MSSPDGWLGQMAKPKDWIITDKPYCRKTDGCRAEYVLEAKDADGGETCWSFFVCFQTVEGLNTSLPKGHERFWTSSGPPPVLKGRLACAFNVLLRLKEDSFPTDRELLLSLAWSGIQVKIGNDLQSDFAREVEAPIIRALGEVFDEDFAKTVVSFCPRPEKC